MVIGLGIDICKYARIEAALSKHGERFIKKILTQCEHNIFRKISNPDQKIAFVTKRFAAKEATVKALGTGISHGVSWQHVGVTNDAFGKPVLKLTSKALEKAKQLGAKNFHISISDEQQEIACACVILES